MGVVFGPGSSFTVSSMRSLRATLRFLSRHPPGLHSF
jgi:hypothetical protein